MAETAKRTGAPYDAAIRVIGWGGAGLLLLAPLIAMRFTPDVKWTATDFGAAAIMLGSAGLACEIALRMSDRLAYRLAAAMGIGGALALTWINLAVGFIGSEDNPANAAYFAVVAVELAGALIARFKARGMAWALGLTAAAQALAGGVAFVLTSPVYQETVDSAGQLIGLNLAFVILFAISAGLFARVARDDDQP